MKIQAKTKKFIIDIVYDVIGSIFFAIGIYTFAKSANFAPGGISGLALIINYLIPQIPIGIATLILNIPLILMSYRLLGKKFLIKSIKTMIISTFFLDFVIPLFPMYADDKMLASIFSGIFLGIGLALIYMRGSSTGGADFLLISLKKLIPHMSMGDITLIIDGIIIILGGIVFKDVNSLLFGAVSTIILSLVIDRLMLGSNTGKLAIIVTNKGEEITKNIDKEIGRGATHIDATGTYTKKHKDMLFCTCSNKEIHKIRDIIYENDSSAFVMITDASEVFGEGFKTIDEKLF